jgi:preprotein translocase subunit SecD
MRNDATIMLSVSLLAVGGCALFGPRGETDQPDVEPLAIRFHIASDEPRPDYETVTDERGAPLSLWPEPLVTERDVIAAALVSGSRRHMVQLEFAPEAAAYLYRVTRSHVGRRLAVFVDDTLVMSPVLQVPFDRYVVIDGDFSRRRAEEIVARINGRVGPRLPLPGRTE